MKEAFLQYIWENDLFDHNNMRTVTGQKLEIIKRGKLINNSCTTFFDAQIKIGDILWNGNIEVHVTSRNIKQKGKEASISRKNVILNVVDYYEKPIYNSRGEEILTYKLSYSDKLAKTYEELINNTQSPICLSKLSHNDILKFKISIHSLTIERLERKYIEILRILQRNKYSWEETMYQLVARYFGANTNATAFEKLAQSIPQKILARQKQSSLQLEALLLGQSGLLYTSTPDTYQDTLITEYEFLKNKYSLKPLNKSIWKFTKTRPYSTPSLRIAQFAHFIWNSESLFSKILEKKSTKDIRNLFEISASIYWDTHFDFSISSKRKIKTMGKNTIDIIIINAIIPIIFTYGKYNKQEKHINRAINLLETIKPESNRITKQWEENGIKIQDAGESQAIIQLKTQYCEKKQCLHCIVGNILMHKNVN